MIHFDIKEYTEVNDEDFTEVIYRDYTKKTAPKLGVVFVAYLVFEKPRRLWAFSNVLDLPAERWLSVAAFVEFATMQVGPEDLKKAFEKSIELLNVQDYEGAMVLNQQCKALIEMSNDTLKWLNLATCFLFFDDENPLVYDMKQADIKKQILYGLPENDKKAIAEFSQDYFSRIIEELVHVCPEMFTASKEEGKKHEFYETLQHLREKETSLNLMLLKMVNEVPTARDYILQYPISDLYSDIRYFILNNQKDK